MAILKVCVASYAYEARSDEELTIAEGDILLILELEDADWWKARKETFIDGQLMEYVGVVPSNYVIEAPTLKHAKTIYSYAAQTDDEISFEANVEVQIVSNLDPDWWVAKINNSYGLLPSNYVQIYQDTVTDSHSSHNLQNEVSSAPLKMDSTPSSLNTKPEETINTTPSENAKWFNILEVDKTNKKKKTKGTLAVDEKSIWYCDNSKKKNVIQQYKINDLLKFSTKGKHIYLDFFSLMTCDFKANSNSEAETICKVIKANYDSIKKQEYEEAQKIPESTKEINIANEIGRLSGSFKDLSKTSQISSPKATSYTNLATLASVLYDFEGNGIDELHLKAGDKVMIEDPAKNDQGWVKGRLLESGKEGLLPLDYVQIQLNAPSTTEVPVSEAASISTNIPPAPPLPVVSPITEEKAKPKPLLPTRQRSGSSIDQVISQKPEAPVQPPALPILPPRTSSATPSTIPAKAPPRPIRGNVETMSDTQLAPSLPPAEKQFIMEQDSSSETKTSGSLNYRMWTDASGSFKVEAEYLGVKDGKVLLHKSNNVRIAVPLSKLCPEDNEYIQKLSAGASKSEENIQPSEAINKNPSIQPSVIIPPKEIVAQEIPVVAPTPLIPKPKIFIFNNFNWLTFFESKNVSSSDAEEYAAKFVEEKMDESSVEFITKDLLKDMGVKHGDILRIMNHLSKEELRQEQPKTPDVVSPVEKKIPTSMEPIPLQLSGISKAIPPTGNIDMAQGLQASIPIQPYSQINMAFASSRKEPEKKVNMEPISTSAFQKLGEQLSGTKLQDTGKVPAAFSFNASMGSFPSRTSFTKEDKIQEAFSPTLKSPLAKQPEPKGAATILQPEKLSSTYNKEILASVPSTINQARPISANTFPIASSMPSNPPNRIPPPVKEYHNQSKAFEIAPIPLSMPVNTAPLVATPSNPKGGISKFVPSQRRQRPAAPSNAPSSGTSIGQSDSAINAPFPHQQPFTNQVMNPPMQFQQQQALPPQQGINILQQQSLPPQQGINILQQQQRPIMMQNPNFMPPQQPQISSQPIRPQMTQQAQPFMAQRPQQPVSSFPIRPTGVGIGTNMPLSMAGSTPMQPVNFPTQFSSVPMQTRPPGMFSSPQTSGHFITQNQSTGWAMGGMAPTQQPAFGQMGGDKYAIFKEADPNAPSIFSSPAHTPTLQAPINQRPPTGMSWALPSNTSQQSNMGAGGTYNQDKRW